MLVQSRQAARDRTFTLGSLLLLRPSLEESPKDTDGGALGSSVPAMHSDFRTHRRCHSPSTEVSCNYSKINSIGGLKHGNFPEVRRIRCSSQEGPSPGPSAGRWALASPPGAQRESLKGTLDPLVSALCSSLIQLDCVITERFSYL